MGSRFRIWSQGLLQPKEENGLWSMMVALKRATPPTWGKSDSRASSLCRTTAWPRRNVRCTTLGAPSSQEVWVSSRSEEMSPGHLLLNLAYWPYVKEPLGMGVRGKCGPSGKEGVLLQIRQRKKKSQWGKLHISLFKVSPNQGKAWWEWPHRPARDPKA